MPTGKQYRKKDRLARILRLLRSIRPLTLPVVHRHNQITFFHEGAKFFDALYSAIRAAEKFVLVEYFLIRNDRTGNALASELADAVRRGVRVLLIYDFIGSIETPSSFFQNMKQQSIEVVAFNVPSFKRGLHWFDRRDHRKLAIIDGVTAFLGGFNIGDEYAGLTDKPLRFHDAGIRISGSAVPELAKIFSKTWSMERKENQPIDFRYKENIDYSLETGQGNVVIVSGGPHHRRSYIHSALLINVASTSEEILIATPYFIPGARIMRSLLRAARRGVRVRLLLPARCDIPLVRLLGHSYYSTLLRSGIEVFEIEHEILHAKVMLFDRKRAVIGSANLDQRSFHRNFEINLIIEDSVFCEQIKSMFCEDFGDSKQIALNEHEQRGIITRALERLFSLFDWFL